MQELIKFVKNFLMEGEVVQFPNKKAPANDTGNYTSDTSHFNKWHDENVKQNDGKSLKSIDAYGHYVSHAEDNNQKYLSHEDFHRNMLDKGYHLQKIAGSKRFIGLHIGGLK